MLTRRRFITAGIAGGALLGVAWWLRRRGPTAGDPRFATLSALDAEAPVVIAAIASVLLDGALPADAAARAVAIDETVAGVAQAIAGLPPAAQKELGELFTLLGLAPARIALARVTPAWSDASPAEVGAFLERWRTSSLTLLRSAYDALHQLVFAAWYGNPRSWPAIGYGGPPAAVLDERAKPRPRAPLRSLPRQGCRVVADRRCVEAGAGPDARSRRRDRRHRRRRRHRGGDPRPGRPVGRAAGGGRAQVLDRLQHARVRGLPRAVPGIGRAQDPRQGDQHPAGPLRRRRNDGQLDQFVPDARSHARSTGPRISASRGSASPTWRRGSSRWRSGWRSRRGTCRRTPTTKRSRAARRSSGSRRGSSAATCAAARTWATAAWAARSTPSCRCW